MALFDDPYSGNYASMNAPSPWEVNDPNARKYDISAITGAIGQLKNSPYQANRQGYSPYQFKTPNYGSIGSYGSAAPQEVSSAYDTGLNAAISPLRAQGNARMRSMSQGFEGGRFNGPAARELAMKNAAQTGSDIADVGKTIGSGISQRMLQQGETARAANWQDAGQRRDVMFQAEQDRQKNEAAQNFQSAGFSDSQAQFMANDQLQRANAMAGLGGGLLSIQRNLGQDAWQRWMDMQGAGRALTGSYTVTQ